MEEINNKNIIKNISYDQSEILLNIMKLYNNEQPFECDITASELKFYKKGKKDKYEIPVPKILMDVFPQREDIIKITPFHKLPLEDNSISSIVVDLPFVISPRDSKSKTTDIKEGSNLISNRFSSFYPADELFENIYWWIKECYRVLKENGICVWKMQSTVSGGRECWSAPFSFMVADKIGFYVIDEFILEAKARIVANTHFQNGQQHARKYTSTFWVFKKDEKKAKVNSCFRWLELCEMQHLEGKVWDNNKKNKELNKQLDLKYGKPGRKRKQVTDDSKPLTYYEQMKERVLNKTLLENVTVEPEVTPIEKEPTKAVKKTNKKRFPIVQLDLSGQLIKEWDNYDEIIKKYTKISKSSLSQCINGKIKTAGRFIWKRKEIGE